MWTTAPSVVAPLATSRHLPSALSDRSSPYVQVWLGPVEQAQVCGRLPLAVLPSVTSRHLPLAELTTLPVVAASALVTPAIPSPVTTTAGTRIASKRRVLKGNPYAGTKRGDDQAGLSAWVSV